MQPKPEGWPSPSPIERVPEVYLSLTGSSWPPAANGVPRGVAEAGSWSVSRQLTGSSLPGQVRGATGHSIATGSVDFAQPEGAPLTPWAQGTLNISPGGRCKLYASHAGPNLTLGLMLGSFVVAPIQGANTSKSIMLELDEDSIRLQRPFTLDWYYDANMPTFDASWVLGKIAEYGGYTATDIEPSGSILNGVFGVSGQSAWEVAQEIAAATMGAVWISESGVFTYRSRASLRGEGVFTETVQALDSIESLDWRLDPGDIADRVELNFIPTRVEESDVANITIWEATDKIRVRAQQSAVVYADIQGTTPRVAPFLPLWSEAAPPEERSRWAAATSANGSGEQPANDAITVTATIVSPSRVRINLENNTNQHLWMVDGNGQPSLILRTTLHVAPGEPETIQTGRSEEQALNPLSLDAGSWVQDPDTAHQMLNWITGQTERAQATVNQVRVAPDLTRQIGDVIRLEDGHTNLLSKALITGITNAGDAGGYTQHLDLALLDVTFTEWDTWMRKNGINTIDQLDAWMQANNINTFTAFDQWGQTLGGTL